MSGPQKKKEWPTELRILLASVLSMAVIFGWAKFLAPKPPVNPPVGSAAPAVTAPAPATPSATPSAAAASTGPAGSSASAAAHPAAPPKADTQERSIVVENDLYRVEFSNRGAVVKSWQLKNYTDDAKPRRVLDVVHPEAALQTGGWPFSLALEDPQLEAAANSGLYQLTSGGDSLRAPAEAVFAWSNGQLEVTKTFHFDDSYVVRVETSVQLNGAPIPAGLAWRGGFGDLTVANPAPVEQVFIIQSQNGKLQNLPYKKLSPLAQSPRGTWQPGNDFAGIEDRYFTAVFLPANGAASKLIATRYWVQTREVQAGDKKVQEPVSEVAVTAGSPLDLRVFVGPKDYDLLKKMNPPLQVLVQFGWLEFIADPIFHLLKWIHKYVPNWGWAIILLTLVINMLLFPLRITSYRTSQKMQKVAGEVKQIQERYKKYKLNDPKKREMNEQVMAIYKREGINPAGGCFQMFLQMPIWFGLNTALRYSIELRHAAWIWIRDLSTSDPYYVLPVSVGLSMYLVSKMTPVVTTDPQQQTMMKFMPISMAVLFVVFPFSSGLALYILTSSVVGIGQQWYLNKTHPALAPAKPERGKRA
ncbi:MAG TPA: membrane protein insertase YidC [Candidatus Acidoferrales bacterium]|nr:membrane protein insertase YidC [Candidatus Acidoferrales bacterium]